MNGGTFGSISSLLSLTSLAQEALVRHGIKLESPGKVLVSQTDNRISHWDGLSSTRILGKL